MNIVFREAYLDKFARRHQAIRELVECSQSVKDQLILHQTGLLDPTLRGYLNNQEVSENRGEFEFLTQSMIRKVILHFIRKHYHTQAHTLQRGVADKLESVKQYLLDNLDSNLLMSSLAARFNCGVSTLQRQFREHYGQTIHECFFEKRMEKAMALLLENRYSINEIGTMVGYREASSFTHAFNRAYGVAPIQFIRNNQPDGNPIKQI